MDKKALCMFVLLVFAAACLLLLPSCSTTGGGVVICSEPAPAPKKSGPPAWAPAHGYRAKHRYRYYPYHYVYYDIERGVYFYVEGDNWQVSVRLPSSIHIGCAKYVTLELETEKPYEHFTEHKKKYPPGLAKKDKKPNKNKKK